MRRRGGPLHHASRGPPPPHAGEEAGRAGRAGFLPRETGEGDHAKDGGGGAASENPVTAALATFRSDDQTARWRALPFFRDGEVDRIAAALDRAVAAGADLAPAPAAIFDALRLTPLPAVKAVILGQDPYPRAGDAHGLAFSYRGTRAMPPSLRTILAELATDTGCPAPSHGDLTAWARQGVLLLNAALTTEVGLAGAHLRLGWAALADQVVARVSADRPAVAFLLWGANARARATLIDRGKHLVLESGHPSPLNRARDFPGSRPFSRANAWLRERGEEPIDWRLPATAQALS